MNDLGILLAKLSCASVKTDFFWEMCHICPDDVSGPCACHRNMLEQMGTL